MINFYSCELCAAQCTFEAMQMCLVDKESCPTYEKLLSGEITDRRLSDIDPNFPSDFTYVIKV